jgi:hypothetical protein
MVAASIGMEADRIEVFVEKYSDLRGTLGLAPELPSGFTARQVWYEIDAPTATSEIARFASARDPAQQHSPPHAEHTPSIPHRTLPRRAQIVEYDRAPGRGGCRCTTARRRRASLPVAAPAELASALRRTEQSAECSDRVDGRRPGAFVLTTSPNRSREAPAAPAAERVSAFEETG